MKGYFEYIIKKHETLTDKLLVQIYDNIIQNRITFKMISGFYIELLTPEITEEKITKGKNDENVPHLENIEVVLVYCKILKNKYQRESWVLPAFVPNDSFGQLLNILPKNHVYTEKFYSEFSYIEVWFTDQNSKSLETEDRIDFSSVINDSGISWDILLNLKIGSMLKAMDFNLLQKTWEQK